MEYARKCTVCGKIWCYTDEDLRKNKTNSISAGISAVGTIASLLGGGSVLSSAYLNHQTNKYGDRVIDYTKCPNCNSERTYLLGDESKKINNPKSQPLNDLSVEEEFEDMINRMIQRGELTVERAKDLSEDDLLMLYLEGN